MSSSCSRHASHVKRGVWSVQERIATEVRQHDSLVDHLHNFARSKTPGL
jgi:hypothetical protein